VWSHKRQRELINPSIAGWSLVWPEGEGDEERGNLMEKRVRRKGVSE